MKRALNLLGVIGLTAFVTFLWVTKNQSEDHARRLNASLAEAEGRVQQLETDIDLANRQIAFLSENRKARPAEATTQSPPPTSSRNDDSHNPPLNLISQDARTTVVAEPLPVPVGVAVWGPYAGGNSNRIRIEGNSSYGKWVVESTSIEGTLVAGDGFPLNAGTFLQTTIANASVNVIVPTRWLKVTNEGRSSHGETLNALMRLVLQADNFPWITFSLDSLSRGKRNGDGKSFTYRSAGKLVIAGLTNSIKMPVEIWPEADGKIRFACQNTFKLSDLNMEHPSLNDEVTVTATWSVKPRTLLQARK